MVDWLAAITALYQKTFVADPDTQVIALISSVLHEGPMCPPNGDVFPLVAFTILLFAEPTGLYSTGGNDDMNVGIIP